LKFVIFISVLDKGLFKEVDEVSLGSSETPLTNLLPRDMLLFRKLMALTIQSSLETTNKVMNREIIRKR